MADAYETFHQELTSSLPWPVRFLMPYMTKLNIKKQPFNAIISDTGPLKAFRQSYKDASPQVRKASLCEPATEVADALHTEKAVSTALTASKKSVSDQAWKDVNYLLQAGADPTPAMLNFALKRQKAIQKGQLGSLKIENPGYLESAADYVKSLWQPAKPPLPVMNLGNKRKGELLLLRGMEEKLIREERKMAFKEASPTIRKSEWYAPATTKADALNTEKAISTALTAPKKSVSDQAWKDVNYLLQAGADSTPAMLNFALKRQEAIQKGQLGSLKSPNNSNRQQVSCATDSQEFFRIG